MQKEHVGKRAFRAFVAAVAVSVLTFTPGGAANAAEPPPAPDTGGWDVDVTAPEDRLPIAPEVAAKTSRAVQRLLATPGTSAAARAAANRDLRVLSVPDGLQADSVSVMAAAPTSRTLTLYYAAQIKSYFCGPATAYMILREEGLTTARDGTGRALTQTNLALTDYLATERDGATKWIGGRMALGVNKWSGNNWYLQLQSPTAGQVQGALLDTIGVNGKAIGGDTVEVLGGPHYNGHPNKLIGHWLAGYGYVSSGATTKWADPSTSYYAGAAQTFSTNTTSFTNTYLQTNGIMY